MRREPRTTSRAGRCCAPTASAARRTTSSCASACAKACAAGRRGRHSAGPTPALKTYYAARAPEYDDWYLRRGRYSRGAIADAAWSAELDQATLWLDALPFEGEIVELAAGTGWWSALLAEKGQLSIYDAVPEPLDRARDRLLAHGLRAHIHVRDAWAEPDRQVDALFCGFWLSHVPRQRLAEFLAICRRWLRPGGLFAFIDSRLDPESSATDHPTPADDMSVRRLNDGREFTIPKIYYAAGRARGGPARGRLCDGRGRRHGALLPPRQGCSLDCAACHSRVPRSQRSARASWPRR